MKIHADNYAEQQSLDTIKIMQFINCKYFMKMCMIISLKGYVHERVKQGTI
jgi:hypothetical protein